MNLLYIIFSAIAVCGRTTDAFDTKHNLLIPPDNTEMVEESFTDETGRWSYKFNSDVPVQVDPSATDLVGLNLAAPIIVTAIFKSTNGMSSCVFSIKQDNRIVLNLCILPVGINISKIELHTDLYSGDDSISNYFNVDFTAKWIKVVVFIHDDKADMYVNGSKATETKTLNKNRDFVLLMKDMELLLADSMMTNNFEGLIEEISLYTNADDDTLKYVCNMIEGEKGDRGLTGDSGKLGQVEPQGSPGISDVGPPGSPGQLVIPGNSIICPNTSNSFSLTTAPEEKYSLMPTNILDDTKLVNDSYTPGIQSYEFTSGKLVQVDPSATGMVGLNMTAPFIVTAIFKSYTGKPSCLFSITQEDRTVMNLCIQQVSKKIFSVQLRTELYSPDDSIIQYFNEDFKEKWMKLVVYVRDDKADLYINCVKDSETLTLYKNRAVVPLTKDMKLQLAYSMGTNKFEGIIEEISLRTNADDKTLKAACNMLRNDFEYGGKQGLQPLEYDFSKDLAECRRDINVLKEGLNKRFQNIEEGINEQIENITMLFQNEIREEIEALKSTNQYLVQELQLLQKRMMSESKTSQGLNLNRSFQEKQDKI